MTKGNFEATDACGICGRRWKKSGMHICAPVEFREKYTVSYLAKRGRVTALALEALWRWRFDYIDGHKAWKKGHQLLFEVTGRAKRDHKKYEELTEAIERIEQNEAW